MAEPLLFLPGMMCDARLFAPQIAALSSRITVGMAPINDHDNVQDLAADFLAHAPKQFALAGLSMGGIVAMEIIRQAPERVARLALMDTNPLAESADRRALRSPQIERVRAGELRSIMRDEMKPNYLTDGPNTGAILDLCMAMAEALGPEVFCRQSVALRDRPDQCDALRAYTGTTLILCGEDDTLCPIERHEQMASFMPNAKLSIIEKAGHLVTLEQPEKVVGELVNWLGTGS